MIGGTTALCKATLPSTSGVQIHVASVGRTTTGVTRVKLTPPSGTTAPQGVELSQSGTLSRAHSVHLNVQKMEKATIGATRPKNTAVRGTVMIPGITVVLTRTIPDTELSVKGDVVGREKTTIGVTWRTAAGNTVRPPPGWVWMSVTMLK